MASKLWRTYATRPVVVLDVEHLGSDPLKNPLPFAFGAVVLRLDAATGKLVIEPGSDRLWILTDPLEGTGTASDPKAVAFWRLPENRTMWTHLFRQRASHVGKPNDIPVIAVEHGVRTHVGHAADFCSDFLAYVEHVKCSSPDGKAAFASDSAAEMVQLGPGTGLSARGARADAPAVELVREWVLEPVRMSGELVRTGDAAISRGSPRARARPPKTTSARGRVHQPVRASVR